MEIYRSYLHLDDGGDVNNTLTSTRRQSLTWFWNALLGNTNGNIPTNGDSTPMSHSASRDPSSYSKQQKQDERKWLQYIRQGQRSSDGEPHRVCLLLIDPQNDFVEPTGALSVPNAVQDANRVSEAFEAHIDFVDGVFVTLDTHQRFHISHAAFWIDSEGKHPIPFTVITLAEVKAKKWRPSRPEFSQHVEKYLEQLERQGRFKHVIWPDHCLFGTHGHLVYDRYQAAVHKWEAVNDHAVSYIIKGNNALTEMYSAIQAEVPMADDGVTHVNWRLIDALSLYSRIVVAGQAMSHCVNFTVRDLVDRLPQERRKDIWIITDGSSPVRGHEAAAQDFIEDMRKKGCRLVTAAQAFVPDPNRKAPSSNRMLQRVENGKITANLPHGV